MITLATEHSVLVLVDYQQRLMPAIDRGAEVVARAVCLAQGARVLGVPILGTEQNPAGLGPNVAPLRELCDQTLSKMHFNACADGLLAGLRRPELSHRTQIVVAGCEAHVCLLQTALDLLEASTSAAEWLGPELHKAYVKFKRAELASLDGCDDAEVCRRYAEVY